MSEWMGRKKAMRSQNVHTSFMPKQQTLCQNNKIGQNCKNREQGKFFKYLLIQWFATKWRPPKAEVTGSNPVGCAIIWDVAQAWSKSNLLGQAYLRSKWCGCP